MPSCMTNISKHLDIQFNCIVKNKIKITQFRVTFKAPGLKLSLKVTLMEEYEMNSLTGTSWNSFY